MNPSSLSPGMTLYIDCASGISGDMMVGALIDLGVPETAIRAALDALPLDGYRVTVGEAMRGGIRGAKFQVLVDGDAAAETTSTPVLDEATAKDALPHVHIHVHEPPHAHTHEDHAAGHGPAPTHGHAHTHYGDIRRMLETAFLPTGVRRRALAIFDTLAMVEAKIHGVPREQVAFHEVGAIDSIVDIVAVAAGLEHLAPARIVSRTVPLGRGHVYTAHGRLPVPAPATLELLRGAPVEEGGIAGELTTPTGAAVLAASGVEYGPFPALTVAAVGWGAGDREFGERPNLLRLVAGMPIVEPAREECLVLEANIDDMSPELVAPLLEALLGAGARDAWLQPVLMKKGRPGYLVAALIDAALRSAVEAVLFAESTTLGVRCHAVTRTVLPRRQLIVDTCYGRIAVKVAGEADRVTNVAPEFEDCRRAASAHGAPLKQVYAAAIAAFFNAAKTS